MHPCLLLEDVLHEIVPYLDWMYHEACFLDRPLIPHARCPVIAFALTCRTFYGPAMRVLWEALEGLAPLLRLFPPGICHQSAGTSGWVFLSLPNNAGWGRFLFYATFVRKITIDYIETPESELRILSLCRRTEHVFPILQALHWRGSEHAFPLSALVFFGPRLREVWVYNFPQEVIGGAAVLDAITHACLQLEELHMEDAQDSTLISTALSTAICSMTSLVEIHARECILDPRALLHLAHLPDLRTLWCSVLSDTDIGTHLNTKIRMKSLKTMKIWTKSHIPMRWSHSSKTRCPNNSKVSTSGWKIPPPHHLYIACSRDLQSTPH